VARHDVIRASRRGEPRVDLADPNSGLEAFVSAAAVEMPRGIRLNAISPGWVRETLADLGMDPSGGTPAAEVARA
jgi:NAD(P)-dependent dehydrogenase (short-subunit alcohol dehydrogenase family)